MATRLTKTKIENAQYDGRTRFLWDDRLPGLGVRVGKTKKAWIYQGQLRGSRRSVRITIGDVRVFDPQSARDAAVEYAQQMAKGIDPRVERRAAAVRGTTLAEAVDAHCRSMEHRRCSSVDMFRDETKKHLGAWWGRALAEITPEELRKRHFELTRTSGPYLGDRMCRNMSALWNTAIREGVPLPVRSVTALIEWNGKVTRRDPIAFEDLPAWYEAVLALRNLVKRDFNVVTLFTGLRKTSCMTIRTDDLTFGPRPTLKVRKPKGGELRAYTLPLGRRAAAILEDRAKDAVNGWVFPGPRDRLRDWRETKCDEAIVSPHHLRHTFASAAYAAGVPLDHLQRLLNHAPTTLGVTEGYLRVDPETLRPSAQRIEDFLWERITGEGAQEGDD